VDYLFLFLVSTGFAKSFFRSLKSSLRSLMSYVVTVVLFFSLFFPFKNLIANYAPFKKEFLEIVLGGFVGQKEMFLQFQTLDMLTEQISTLEFPQMIKNILLFFVEKTENLSVAGVIGESLYQFLLTGIVGIFLFVLLSVGTHILFSFAFMRLKGGEDLFVTKRFFSGCLGGIKGVLLFFTIETALLSFAEVLSISFIKDFVLSSSVGGVGNAFLSDFVLSLSQGLF